jgi:hypothetical protein
MSFSSAWEEAGDLQVHDSGWQGTHTVSCSRPCPIPTEKNTWGISWQEVLEAGGVWRMASQVWQLREGVKCSGLANRKALKSNKCIFCLKGRKERCCRLKWSNLQQTHVFCWQTVARSWLNPGDAQRRFQPQEVSVHTACSQWAAYRTSCHSLRCMNVFIACTFRTPG